MTYKQLISNPALLALAQGAGYSSVQEMLPGLGMFLGDVGVGTLVADMMTGYDMT
jgi:hypothetical protein